MRKRTKSGSQMFLREKNIVDRGNVDSSFKWHVAFYDAEFHGPLSQCLRWWCPLQSMRTSRKNIFICINIPIWIFDGWVYKFLKIISCYQWHQWSNSDQPFLFFMSGFKILVWVLKLPSSWSNQNTGQTYKSQWNYMPSYDRRVVFGHKGSLVVENIVASYMSTTTIMAADGSPSDSPGFTWCWFTMILVLHLLKSIPFGELNKISKNVYTFSKTLNDKPGCNTTKVCLENQCVY